jgi:cell division protein ZapB
MLGGSSITPNFSQSQELILMDKNAIQQLEQQVDELLRTSRRLREENMLLRSQQSAWLTERAQLVEKTDIARNRIEKMVNRLKELDSDL